MNDYLRAREYAGSDPDAVAERMGVQARRAAAAPQPSDDVWRHILRGDDAGGGHLYGADIEGKTQAPQSWTRDDFARAIQFVQASGRTRTTATARIFEGMYAGVIFRVGTMTFMNRWHELAIRLRAELRPYLSGDSAEFVDEWIDEVGEYALAVDELLAVAADRNVRLPAHLLSEASRLGNTRASKALAAA